MGLQTLEVQGPEFTAQGLRFGVWGFRSMFLRAGRMPWRSRQADKDEAASFSCHFHEAALLQSDVGGVGTVTCAKQPGL